MSRLCASCEEEINPKRIQAVPGAKFCVACQEHQDSCINKPSFRGLNRLGAAGKFSNEDEVSRTYRPIVSYGLAAAISGGHGF